MVNVEHDNTAQEKGRKTERIFVRWGPAADGSPPPGRHGGCMGEGAAQEVGSAHQGDSASGHEDGSGGQEARESGQEKEVDFYSIYADGSSCGRLVGPGGWGFVIAGDKYLVGAGYGGENPATNNQMELRAAIEGMRAAKRLGLPGPFELVSDSQYVLGVVGGKYVASKNKELVEVALALAQELRVKRFRWVRGHSGDLLNERCDQLAKLGKEKARKLNGGFTFYGP